MAQVQGLLKAAVQEGTPLLLSPVNLGEIYYIIGRNEGLEKAEGATRMIEELSFEIPPVDSMTSILAAKFKLNHGLGYADAFAAALANLKEAELVTGDKDFKSVEKEIRIVWI